MNQRFYSLDVFRGATVALMILVNNPGSWDHIYAPLDHAAWHGCTPTDLVFPFFLFAVGNAMAFVMPKLDAAGEGAFWFKVIKRTLLIFAIGMFLNWFPFFKYIDIKKGWEITGKPFANLRIFGVLQRIALSYFFASVIIHYLKLKGAFVMSFVILAGYWCLCVLMNPSDPYSLSGWFGTKADLAILGDKHMYHGEGVVFDPEGLMNTFGSIVQVILGYMVGNYIITKGKTAEMLNGLFVAGCVLVFTGFIWDMVFPINKKIWTSSYTVYTTGLALMIISVMIYLLDFKNYKGAWSRFFDVFGKNPLFIFAMSNIVVRLMNLVRIKTTLPDEHGQLQPAIASPTSYFYYKIAGPLFSDPRNASLLYALCFISLMWFLAWVLDKRKIYIKV